MNASMDPKTFYNRFLFLAEVRRLQSQSRNPPNITYVILFPHVRTVTNVISTYSELRPTERESTGPPRLPHRPSGLANEFSSAIASNLSVDHSPPARFIHLPGGRTSGPVRSRSPAHKEAAPSRGGLLLSRSSISPGRGRGGLVKSCLRWRPKDPTEILAGVISPISGNNEI